MHTQSTQAHRPIAPVFGDVELDYHARVCAYKHPELIERLKRKSGFSAEQAAALFEETKEFLYQCGTRRGIELSPPNKDVDEVWHQFILYTRDYAVFCREMFGSFIHHQPRSYFKDGVVDATADNRCDKDDCCGRDSGRD